MSFLQKNDFICIKNQLWTGFLANIMIRVLMSGLPGFRESNPASVFNSGNRNLKPAPGLQDLVPSPFGVGMPLFILTPLIHTALAGNRRCPALIPSQE